MATTTNYGWTTPDDTALVKDGASAIRTLGSSVDTTTKALNPSTTLGDIEYRSSTANTNTRLGIGSTGNVLTVAGGVPTWAAPGGGTKNFSLLNTGGTALSGSSTINITGISNADQILIRVVGASAAINQYNVWLRVNSNSTGIYNFQGPYISAGSGYGASNFGIRGGNSQTEMEVAEWSDNPASIVSGYMLITGAATAGQKVVQFAFGASASGGTGQDLVWGGGVIDTTSTISSINITNANTANFDAGTIYVYTSA
jgi:hypothetical protein